MAGRFTVLQDPRLENLRPVISARMQEAAALISEEAFGEFLDRTMRAQWTLALGKIGAHEGTVWLLDASRRALIPRFNNGPDAASFVGHFRQPLDSGMISMVVATEQPICENAVAENRQQDRTLDQQLGLVTCAMLAVPFYFARELRGVISAVQLRDLAGLRPAPPGFTASDLETLQETATILSRLVEHALLSLALGGEELG